MTKKNNIDKNIELIGNKENMITLNKTNIYSQLFSVFPNLKHKFQSNIDYYLDGEKYFEQVVFGDLLNPYVIELINKNDINELNKIFDFFESMATSNESYVVKILYDNVFKIMYEDENSLMKVKLFMREETKKLFVSINNN